MKRVKAGISKLNLDKKTILSLESGGKNIVGGISGFLSCIDTTPPPKPVSTPQDWACTVTHPTTLNNCPSMKISCIGS
ncbi:hypothetical protein [Taibaiella koreensis]|uniref:hypothetical protein n=1 Tax=Taibaiella koreensis TaxID=1268548 RepID=UPI0013C2EFB6|nr:hypothetical protein [Taibaiella koreensis]